MAKMDQPEQSSDGASNDRSYRGDGPGKIGLTSDGQRGLVAPSGVNERDQDAAGEAPMPGDKLNFDDDKLSSAHSDDAGKKRPA